MSVETLNMYECSSCVSEKKAQRSLQTRLSIGIISVFEYVYGWNERQRSLHQLAQLDDRMLKDIGLSRADVDGEVQKSLWVR